MADMKTIPNMTKKVVSSSTPTFVKPSGKMLPGNDVGTQVAGTTAGATRKNTGAPWAKGGPTGQIGGEDKKVRTSVPGRITVPGASGSNSTGKGGGKRGDGSF